MRETLAASSSTPPGSWILPASVDRNNHVARSGTLASLPMTSSPSGFLKTGAHFDLRDGSTVHVRMIQPSDESAVLKLFQSLSEESRYQRFFCPVKDSALAVEVHREVTLNGTFALIALHGEEERIVGHAFYAELDQTRAEVAFTIAKEFRGLGLATILLYQLANIAVANGIEVFEAEVMGSNQMMLNVFRDSGFPLEVKAMMGQLHVTLHINTNV